MNENNTAKTYSIKLLLVQERPLFPGGVTTLVISREEEIHLIEAISKTDSVFGIVLMKDAAAGSDAGQIIAQQNEKTPEIYKIGTLCKINKFVRLPNGSLHVFVSTLNTFEIKSINAENEILEAEVENREKDEESLRMLVPYVRLLRKTLSELVPQSPIFAFAADVNIANITDPEALANYVASSIQAPKDYLQGILELTSTKEKYERLLIFLENEKSIIIMQNQIRNELFESAKKRNQEVVLRQQIGMLQEELDKITGSNGGMQDPRMGRSAIKDSDVQDIADRYEKIKQKLPQVYKETIEKELSRLSMTDTSSPEYLLTRTYLDTILSLPLPKKSGKPKYKMDNVRSVLDRDHWGMKDVKDRILEFLASRSLSQSNKGAIICLVGPPGVGKTSIGKSIAEALGRKYYRFSVGGMRDEAEIKGHRRTYVGALPGKIIHGLLDCKEDDPLFLIDEIDKIGSSYKGDPASALLEVLDPEQNSRFTDLYLDLPYDLSRILFIVTANTTETIPDALLDRMEIIEVSGYTPTEKLNIAKNYLVPRLIKKNGLDDKNVEISDEALLSIAEEYSREAGVRNYEKNLDKIFRKLALSVIEKKDEEENHFLIGKKEVEKYLGMPVFDMDDKISADENGTAIGLAWTSLGGSVLLIEAEAIYGHEDFKITGQLGDVMKESCNIALSNVKIESALRGIDPSWFKKHVIHLHVPEGATPKDGPSAGITMATALWSMLTEQTIKPDLAMTGELTLTGRVMPIGGLKEKILAARRNHIKEIIIPDKNRRDLELLDSEVKGDVVFHPVKTLSEVLSIAFPNDKTTRLSEKELDQMHKKWESGNKEEK